MSRVSEWEIERVRECESARVWEWESVKVREWLLSIDMKTKVVQHVKSEWMREWKNERVRASEWMRELRYRNEAQLQFEWLYFHSYKVWHRMPRCIESDVMTTMTLWHDIKNYFWFKHVLGGHSEGLLQPHWGVIPRGFSSGQNLDFRPLGRYPILGYLPTTRKIPHLRVSSWWSESGTRKIPHIGVIPTTRKIPHIRVSS